MVHPEIIVLSSFTRPHVVNIFLMSSRPTFISSIKEYIIKNVVDQTKLDTIDFHCMDISQKNPLLCSTEESHTGDDRMIIYWRNGPFNALNQSRSHFD